MELGEDRLPVLIRSCFNKAVTKVMEKPTAEMLAMPISFDVSLAGEKPVPRPVDAKAPLLALGQDARVLQGEGFKLVRQGPRGGHRLGVAGRLPVSANGREYFPASITARAPVEFAVRLNNDAVKIIAGGPAPGDLAEEIASFPRAQFPGQPSRLRLGKMPNSAGPQGHSDPGAVGFNRIEWIRVHGRALITPADAVSPAPSGVRCS